MSDDPIPILRVHVLVFEGCPHAEAALRAAGEAVAERQESVELVEVDLMSPRLGAEFRGYPSPTILVGMREVVPGERCSEGLACRAAGAPSVHAVRLAIDTALEGASRP